MPEMSNLGHIDRALTNISVGYMQGDSAFIADKVFPIIPVQKQSDIYYVYSKSDMFRDEVKERGRGAESAGGNWNITTADPYHCRKYAYHYDITQEERVNYDQPIDVERDTTTWLSQKMLLKREMDFANKFFKTGVWGRNIAGVASAPSTNQCLKFSDQTSDPVKLINDIMLEMAGTSGKKPNFAIMSPDVFYALKNHDAIMDRIKYTQKGIITIDLIASLFELENIYIPWGVVNAGPQTPGYDDTKDATSFIYKGKMLLGYRATHPSLKEATAGYIFSWVGLEGASSYGSRMVRIKMDQLGLGTERFEMEMAYDQKVICKDMGVFLSDLV
jgi:hypothetical protein